jgi:hypothetical protein
MSGDPLRDAILAATAAPGPVPVPPAPDPPAPNPGPAIPAGPRGGAPPEPDLVRRALDGRSRHNPLL